MDQLVLLQMSELGEVFEAARLAASEGSFARMGSYVHFQVTQLAKDLFTGITSVYNLPVLLFQRKWEGPIASVPNIWLVLFLPWLGDWSGCSLLRKARKLGRSKS